MPDPTFDVFVEFAVGSLTTVTSSVLRVSLERGRADGFGTIVSGRATVEFDNEERFFTPENASGPYYNHLKPNRRVVIQAASGYADAPGRRIFYGLVDEWAVGARIGERTAAMNATDNAKNLLRRRIDTWDIPDTQVDSIVAIVFSHAGITGTPSIDAHIEQPRFAWFPDQEAEAALRLLAEGTGFTLYAKHDNDAFVVRHRSSRVNSVAPVASYVNAFENLEYARSDDRIVNEVLLSGSMRLLTAVDSVAFYEQNWLVVSGSAPVHGPKQTVTYHFRPADPFTKEHCPIPARFAGVSFPINALGGRFIRRNDPTTFLHGIGQTSLVATRLKPDSVEVDIYNNNNEDIQPYDLTLLGSIYRLFPTVTVSASVSSSQTEYGRRSVSLSTPLFGEPGPIFNAASGLATKPSYLKDLAEYVVWRQHDLRPDIRVTLKNTWPSQITNDLLDVIWVVESHAAIADKFQIVGISHEINPHRGLEHYTTYLLERFVPAQWFILDQDRLDTGRLGF